jgi:hypothetical protein
LLGHAHFFRFNQLPLIPILQIAVICQAQVIPRTIAVRAYRPP